MIAMANAPAQASTVLTFDSSTGFSFTLPGAAAGSQFTVTVVGGDFDLAVYPEVAMLREIQYLYNGDDGLPSGNEYYEEAVCLADGCRSPATDFSQLLGTSRNLIVRTRPGYNNCTPQTPALQHCGINPDFSLGTLTYYGELLDGSSTITVTISDPTAIPEPGTWLMLVGGFGISGWMLRRHRSGSDFRAA